MTSVLWFAAFFALVGVLGGYLVFRSLVSFRKPTLEQRISPQMPGVNFTNSSETSLTTFRTMTAIAEPVLAFVFQKISKFTMGNGQLSEKLAQSGSRLTVADYRAQQMMFAIGAGGIATACVIWFGLNHGLNPLIGLITIGAVTVLGFLFRDNLLTSQVKKRRAIILAEFPTVAELLALSVAAGESSSSALERVVNTSQGEMSDEFGIVLADLRSGDSLSTALQKCADRLKIDSIERFITGLNVANERGTPLAGVLHSQARDVRDISKRELLELAGKKEIHMLFPLIFGIMPLTVIFAIFPGLSLLQIGF